MDHRVRGAATVSVVWLIMMLVLVLAAGGFIYVLSSERAALQADKAVAVLEADRSLKVANEATDKILVLSRAVGFRDDGDLTVSRVDEITGKLQILRDNFGEWAGKDATTLSRALDMAVGQITETERLLREAKDQQSSAESARDSSEDNLRTTSTQKDSDHADLEQKLADERARSASQEQQDSDRIDKLQQQLDDADARHRAALSDKDSQISALQNQKRTLEGRISEQSSKLAVHRLPHRPDGTVLSVSNAGTCYVDLGRKDLLRRGTRFIVFSYGKGGRMIRKGLVEVRDVEEEMAEAGILQIDHELRPIAVGDFIAAPTYDKNQQREFVMEGRFPAGYSKALVADRLRALGAKVADTVGPSTDFLILGGSEQSNDPDDETPHDPTESENFRLAQTFQVQVLPVREILEYVSYE